MTLPKTMSISGDDPRPPLAPSIKEAIAKAFQAVPPGKKGALLIIADEHGTRGVLAARLSDGWKVAASGGVEWTGRPYGYVALEGVW